MNSVAQIPSHHQQLYEDPCSQPGFQPELYPEEKPALHPSNPDQLSLKAKFRAVYYRRNVCLAKMAAADPADPEYARLLKESVAITRALDALEDACAPSGFLAEPELEDALIARALKFVHAPPAPFAGKVTAESSFSLYIELGSLNEAGGQGLSESPHS